MTTVALVMKLIGRPGVLISAFESRQCDDGLAARLHPLGDDVHAADVIASAMARSDTAGRGEATIQRWLSIGFRQGPARRPPVGGGDDNRLH